MLDLNDWKKKVFQIKEGDGTRGSFSSEFSVICSDNSFPLWPVFLVLLIPAACLFR